MWLLLLALFARADCGGQTYPIEPSSIHPAVLRRTIGVLTFVSSGAPEGVVVVPVSAWPSCHGREGIHGFQVPLLAVRGEKVLIVPDATKYETAWIDKAGAHVILFDSLREYAGLDVHFAAAEVRLYERPSLSAPSRLIKGERSTDSPRSAYKYIRREGPFAEIGTGGAEEDPFRPLGWILLRPSGRLAVWPSFYDDG